MRTVNLDGPGARDSKPASELLAAWPFVADAWPGQDRSRAAGEALGRLGDDSRVTALAGGEGWRWMAALTPLPLDGQIFGRPMAKIAPLAHREAWPGPEALQEGRDFLAAVMDEAGRDGIKGLVARVPVRDVLAAQCLESAGFLLMDVSVEWLADLERLPEQHEPAAGGMAVRTWRPEDEPVLRDLAGRALCDLAAYPDRFAMDPRMRPSCQEMYRRWMANSLAGDQADQVLVLDMEGEAVGFITLRLPPGGDGPEADCGTVVLNAVAPEHRGKGLYHLLLRRGLRWLAGHGAARARVRTKLAQGAVIRAWAAVGARQVYSDLTFHHWLD